MDTAERVEVESRESVTYDGFISYSHAADDLLAPRLQAGLQRFAKPWWKRRAVRIFRDESSLAANPHLWSSITEALDDSGWFVLLLSPDAATSEWVGKEIEHWVANKPADRILPVVTDGEFGWVDGDVRGSSVPPALRGVFGEEPRWVDLRFAKGDENLDLQNPDFSAAVADVASAIRGVPKDELASEEVRQHRRTVRTAWAAGIAVTVLAIAAVVAGILALGERNRAEDEADRANTLAAQEAAARQEADANAALAERNAAAEAEARQLADQNSELAQQNAALAEARELAASAINVLDTDPELAILLTLEAIDATPAGRDQPVEVISALWEAGAANRRLATLTHGFGGFTPIDLSPDGTRLVVVSSEGAAVQMYDARNQTLVWERAEDTVDSPHYPAFSPDGTLVSVPFLDSTSFFNPAFRDVEPDDLPSRVLVLDSAEGSLVRTLEFPFCPNVAATAWSPDGGHLAVALAPPGPQAPGSTCTRPESPGGMWVEVFDSSTWESVAVIDVPLQEVAFDAVFPAYDDSGRLFLFSSEAPRLFSAGDYRPLGVIEGAIGARAVSPDGGLVATFSSTSSTGASLYDTSTGQRVDRLGGLDAFPSLPRGLAFSGDGQYLTAGTDGTNTFIYDVFTGEILFTVPGDHSNTAVMDPTGTLLYTGHDDGTVKVWDLGPGAFGRAATGDLGEASWVNGNSFEVGPELGSFIPINLDRFEFFIRFFNLDTGQVLDTVLDGQRARPLADGRFLVAKRAEWYNYDPATGEQLYLFGCESEDDVTCINPEQRIGYFNVITSVEGDEAAVWDERGAFLVDPATGAELSQLTVAPDFAGMTGFTKDWILEEGSEFIARDRESNQVLWTSPPPDTGAELSPGGTTLVFVSQGRLGVVSTESWEERSVPVDFGRVRGLAVSSDDRWLAVGDQDRMHIIDLESLELVQVVPIPGVSDAHWVDSEALVVGTNTGFFGTVSLNIDSLIEDARAGVSRTFTAQECLTYRIDPCPAPAEEEHEEEHHDH